MSFKQKYQMTLAELSNETVTAWWPVIASVSAIIAGYGVIRQRVKAVEARVLTLETKTDATREQVAVLTVTAKATKEALDHLNGKVDKLIEFEIHRQRQTQ